MASEQKERILRFYRGSEGEQTAVRLLDLAEGAVKTRKFRVSSFLDPYGQEIAETICASYDDIQLDFEGGYAGVQCSAIRILRERRTDSALPVWRLYGTVSLRALHTVTYSVL